MWLQCDVANIVFTYLTYMKYNILTYICLFLILLLIELDRSKQGSGSGLILSGSDLQEEKKTRSDL